MSSVVVKLDRFAVLREGVPLFRPVDLALSSGDVVSVAGRNGAGKSTLLGTLAGLAYPQVTWSGACTILSVPGVSGAAELSSQGVVLIRQQPTAYRGLRVAEQMAVAAGAPCGLVHALAAIAQCNRDPSALAAHIAHALQAFGLDAMADTPMAALSIGQRRAVSLAAARVRLALGRLRLLLLDEPQSGLDAFRRDALARLIAYAAAQGCAVLIAEHAGEDERSLAPRLLTLTPPASTQGDSP